MSEALTRRIRVDVAYVEDTDRSRAVGDVEDNIIWGNSPAALSLRERFEALKVELAKYKAMQQHVIEAAMMKEEGTCEES